MAIGALPPVHLDHVPFAEVLEKGFQAQRDIVAGIFGERGQGVFVEVIVVVVGEDHIELRDPQRLEIGGRERGGRLPLGQQGPVRQHGVRQPVGAAQSHQEGGMADPEDEVPVPHGPDPFCGVGEDGRQEPVVIELIVIEQFPLQEGQKTLLFHRQPGVEIAAVLEVRRIEVLRSGGRDPFAPLCFIETLRRPGTADHQQTHNERDRKTPLPRMLHGASSVQQSTGSADRDMPLSHKNV